jgi:hypothetical protein
VRRPPPKPQRPRIEELPAPVASRYGTPVLTRVDTAIFSRRYFTHCMSCTFCHDWCCSDGVDVDLVHLEALRRHAPGLEAYTGIPRNRWFRTRVSKDPEMPGGGSVRTRVAGGQCVFRSPSGRGCLVHGFCVNQGIDYHELKPMVDCLFPLTFAGGMLTTASEVDDDSLVCLDTGPTLYRGLRDEVAYYFGPALIDTLDRLEASGPRAKPPTGGPEPRRGATSPSS